ncbi:hypothetical protein [Pyrobaculum neutrophilum]|uniref:DUF5678 domain-containing protein n=1 Tax=Pyrobaculum neutrophilum (strain DSM 2338 / JCM 9278 / NBRC 100436 / V24Sta) TaxID=444157 RepID=B1Y9F8_PYRNV|nr:hypothetical protein [Pyrobaculum neutrophilum]ACB40387.1 conserved hypothetical protein [Pyrobaculum neutrophilum V24Sta]
MIEEELERWAEVARRSGRRGWVLVKEGKVVGVYPSRKDAILSAREPGIYLLLVIDF